MTPELETALLALLNAAKTWEQYTDESSSPTARAADHRLCMAIGEAKTALGVSHALAGACVTREARLARVALAAVAWRFDRGTWAELTRAVDELAPGDVPPAWQAAKRGPARGPLDAIDAATRAAWDASSGESFAAAAALVPPVAGPEAAAPVPLGKNTRTVSPLTIDPSFSNSQTVMNARCSGCGRLMLWHGQYTYCGTARCPQYAPPVVR